MVVSETPSVYRLTCFKNCTRAQVCDLRRIIGHAIAEQIAGRLCSMYINVRGLQRSWQSHCAFTIRTPSILALPAESLAEVADLSAASASFLGFLNGRSSPLPDPSDPEARSGDGLIEAPSPSRPAHTGLLMSAPPSVKTNLLSLDINT